MISRNVGRSSTTIRIARIAPLQIRPPSTLTTSLEDDQFRQKPDSDSVAAEMRIDPNTSPSVLIIAGFFCSVFRLAR